VSTKSYSHLRWLSDFPAGLDTETDAADLKDGFSPAACGLGLDPQGRLFPATIPSGTARVDKTYAAVADQAGATATYTWLYNKLWRIDTTTLLHGAMNYNDAFLPQGTGKIEFVEDTGSILSILPFGTDGLVVFKATGAYLLSNVLDTRDLIQKSDLLQTIRIASASHATALDGTVYASTPTGLYAITPNGEVDELSAAARTRASLFSGKALTVDYGRKRIIGAASFVYDAVAKRLFDYTVNDGLSFLWTSPTFHAPDYSPIQVSRVLFHVEHILGQDETLDAQVRVEDEAWTDEERIAAQYVAGSYSIVAWTPQTPLYTCRRFALRLTGMSAGLRVRGVALDVAGDGLDGVTV
jgi:hypothetical protein